MRWDPTKLSIEQVKPLLFARQCVECRHMFLRESGWRVWNELGNGGMLQPPSAMIKAANFTFCNVCAPSKLEALQLAQKKIEQRGRPAPPTPAPPPKRI